MMTFPIVLCKHALKGPLDKMQQHCHGTGCEQSVIVIYCYMLFGVRLDLPPPALESITQLLLWNNMWIFL